MAGSRPGAHGGQLAVIPLSGLADVVELDQDTDLVIDAFIRVSLIGIEFLTIDVRVVGEFRRPKHLTRLVRRIPRRAFSSYGNPRVGR